MQCPSTNSFRFNSSSCACNPGFLYNATANVCSPFTVSGADEFLVGTGVDYSINFPETILSFDSIKKYTQSQGVFLGATLVMIVTWLLFCFFVRFGDLGDGRTPWYKIRWAISRLDICFATRHWLDDQKVLKKRKTELGGAFSIASCILFIGLFAALLYQIISKRTIEVHSVVAANAPDLTSFHNDMEFNITTISTMSCSNIRGLGTLYTGNPGFLDFRTNPLSTFANFSCQNTTKGPKVTLKCNNCQLLRDNFYTSWHFLDLPNTPASAVGFEFNLTAKDHEREHHMSFVSGILKNGSGNNGKFVTFRGRDPNILQFNLFPRIYRNKRDLKLIQPLLHEFLPGSSFDEINQMFRVQWASLLIWVACIVLVSAFFSTFWCKFKKFRHEDSIMRRIRSQRKAQERWDKLRKYVIFTWGRGSLPLENEGSSKKRKHHIRKDTISFNTKVSIPDEKKFSQEKGEARGVACCFGNSGSIPVEKISSQVAEYEGSDDVKYEKEKVTNNDIPLPPSLEIKPGSELSASEIQKNLQNLYEYNVMLREELIVAQSMLHTLTSKASAS
ncbi:unnamed protein product [Lactuca saligna]|uniref:Uncharacterized protein n=1 Tax=Lactuca saligna TaxID=75948 RepID=A0AA36A298_LACSI|nr:unnamed protein product [Lactuca saligna]